MKKTVFLPICVIGLTALLLFGTSLALDSVAEANARAARLELLRTLLPGSTSFVPEPYRGEDPNIRSVHNGGTGFVVETSAAGYAGEIVMLVGVSKDGAVTGLVVSEMHETVGLGADALTNHEFLSQFLNLKGSAAIGTSGADAFSGATAASGHEASVYVDALTGATVTSKAIARCVNSAIAYVTGADAGTGATSWGG